MNKNAQFDYDCFYHIFNRTNNKEALFPKAKHRHFFLSRYKNYILPFADTHAYALLGNHFHFCIKIKNADLINQYLENIPEENRTVLMKKYIRTDASVNDLIINQFQNFQNSYAKAVNKDMDRRGSLFQKKFKRSLFLPEEKYKYLIYYIHHNARKHGLVNKFLDYPHHSYNEILNNPNTWLDAKESIKQFISLGNFVDFHHSNQFESLFRSIDIEGILD